MDTVPLAERPAAGPGFQIPPLVAQRRPPPGATGWRRFFPAARSERKMRPAGSGRIASAFRAARRSLPFAGLAAGVALVAAADIPSMMAVAGFEVRKVVVEGASMVTVADIAEATGVVPGDPIFAFDPRSMRAQVEGVPWVSSAEIHRALPDVVRIRITERQPYAIWQDRQSFRLVSADGRVLTEEPSVLARHAGLPLIVGPDAHRKAVEAVAIMEAAPSLSARVKGVVEVGGRRWDVHLEDGPVLRLPEDGPDEAFSEVAGLEARSPFLDRSVLSVDMRIKGRMVVRLTPEAAAMRLQPPPPPRRR
jgi:cell division protein FtsQ